MDAKTLEALKGSIKKWEMIRDGEMEDDGRDNCPLCHVFYTVDQSLAENCVGCPIYDKTKFKYCQKTPYVQFCNAKRDERPELSNAEWTQRRIELAQNEVDFLESLLPGEADA